MFIFNWALIIASLVPGGHSTSHPDVRHSPFPGCPVSCTRQFPAQPQPWSSTSVMDRRHSPFTRSIAIRRIMPTQPQPQPQR